MSASARSACARALMRARISAHARARALDAAATRARARANAPRTRVLWRAATQQRVNDAKHEPLGNACARARARFPVTA